MKALMLFVCMILTSVSIEAKEFAYEHDTIQEKTIFFGQDKSTVSIADSEKLRALSQGKVEVFGFASSEGDVDYNLRLSARRANAVHFIMDRPAIMTYIGEGEASSAIDPKDRKVLIRVTTTELAYNPIFEVDGTLQGVLSHQLYNVVPIR